jgi:hypothetical protein
MVKKFSIELPADVTGQKTSSVPVTEAGATEWATPVYVAGSNIKQPIDIQGHNLPDTTPLPVKITGGIVKTASAVTTSDSVNLTAGATSGLYLGATGDISVVLAGGGTITFTGMASGVIHPISVTRVNATGTTATGIVAVYA